MSTKNITNNTSKNTKLKKVSNSKLAYKLKVIEINQPSATLLVPLAKYLFEHLIYSQQTEDGL